MTTIKETCINPLTGGVLNDFPFVEDEFQALSLYKLICDIASQIDGLKELVETLETEIQGFDERITTIESQISGIHTDIRKLKNADIELKNYIDSKLASQLIEVNRLLLELHATINVQINDLKVELEEEIQKIKIGDIQLYDPSTGLLSPLQTVINNIYYAQIDTDEITASEFDNLELTVTQFENYEITAYSFDLYAKKILQ